MDLEFTNEVDEIIKSEIGSTAVLVIASTGEIKTIRVVFHKEYSVEDNLETQWEAYQIYVECKRADVEDAAQNDTITINSIDYNIESIEQSEGGWTILRLSV